MEDAIKNEEWLTKTIHIDIQSVRDWKNELKKNSDPRSDKDRVDPKKPNTWLMKYPEERRISIICNGKDEHRNPINRVYNEKLIEIYDDVAKELDDSDINSDSPIYGEYVIDVWAGADNFLYENWRRYIYSGLSSKLGFDEFVEAYENVMHIFAMELIEAELNHREFE